MLLKNYGGPSITQESDSVLCPVCCMYNYKLCHPTGENSESLLGDNLRYFFSLSFVNVIINFQLTANFKILNKLTIHKSC